ncbi:hypothetical protein Dform_00378 [Dehalogenimonas formicexedens]|uniref:Uncharacterized protein n=1 Tax=Dehalogenimonas formicexedens TaxID=1839801 RepID=A0A1P8F5H3_9CHLR|nr:hypothetical protein [Dehalogenimonas formicexedens]APV43737.1 hypothetical protein Dform_00378 [Dehalogenimonas formicexedens]
MGDNVDYIVSFLEGIAERVKRIMKGEDLPNDYDTEETLRDLFRDMVWLTKFKCFAETASESDVENLIIGGLATEFPCFEESAFNIKLCDRCDLRFACHTSSCHGADNPQGKRQWILDVIRAGVKRTVKDVDDDWDKLMKNAGL